MADLPHVRNPRLVFGVYRFESKILVGIDAVVSSIVLFFTT